MALMCGIDRYVLAGYGAVMNTMKCEEGCVAAVFGLGAVGLAAIMGLKKARARRIIAVDINEKKFKQAKEVSVLHVKMLTHCYHYTITC
jgi:S-(hydroxymethyl)glutathione dehydrogenase / alcohol dehydrogenase